jgi:hypothetical protein
MELSLKVNATDSFPVYSSVYTGDSCDELSCVSEDGVNDPFNPVVWTALEGETYWIFVFGFPYFTVIVEESQRPSNSECTEAISLEPGDILAGSTMDAALVEIVNCGITASAVPYPALFYTITGTGGLFEVMLKSDIGVTHSVSILSGDSCSDLTCIDYYAYVSVAGFYDFTNDYGVVWQTVEDEVYYIAILQTSDIQDFELQVAEVSRPPNDDCNSSIELEVGDILSGSIRYASENENENADCGMSSRTVKGQASQLVYLL